MPLTLVSISDETFFGVVDGRKPFDASCARVTAAKGNAQRQIRKTSNRWRPVKFNCISSTVRYSSTEEPNLLRSWAVRSPSLSRVDRPARFLHRRAQGLCIY